MFKAEGWRFTVLTLTHNLVIFCCSSLFFRCLRPRGWVTITNFKILINQISHKIIKKSSRTRQPFFLNVFSMVPFQSGGGLAVQNSTVNMLSCTVLNNASSVRHCLFNYFLRDPHTCGHRIIAFFFYATIFLSTTKKHTGQHALFRGNIGFKWRANHRHKT